MKRENVGRRNGYLSISVIALLALAWWIGSKFVSELFLPSPASVLAGARTLGWTVVVGAATTFLRVILGWSVGSICGVGFGLLLTRSQNLHDATNPIIEILRPMPAVALIPFFILWFGTGELGQILLIFIAAFMTLTIHTYNAVSTVPLELIRAAWSLGASSNRVYRAVILPFLLPSLKGGLQIACALAFATGIAAEFMGAQSGLGFLIMVARRTLNTNVILLGTILIALESYTLDLVIRKAVDTRCRWVEPTKNNLQELAAAGDNP